MKNLQKRRGREANYFLLGLKCKLPHLVSGYSRHVHDACQTQTTKCRIVLFSPFSRTCHRRNSDVDIISMPSISSDHGMHGHLLRTGMVLKKKVKPESWNCCTENMLRSNPRRNHKFHESKATNYAYKMAERESTI